MALRIRGTITFLRSAKIKIIRRSKKPATHKKPRAVLCNKAPSHQASAVKRNPKKNKPKTAAAMPMAAPAAALEAPLVALALAN